MLPQLNDFLELGGGSGQPVTKALVTAGLQVFAIDASPTLLDRFRQAFPSVETRCENVLSSNFFDRQFAAGVAVGLVFLLQENQ